MGGAKKLHPEFDGNAGQYRQQRKVCTPLSSCIILIMNGLLDEFLICDAIEKLTKGKPLSELQHSPTIKIAFISAKLFQ